MTDGTQKRILVVDDDDALRKLFRKILTSNGYSVVEAPDGKVGLFEFNRQHVDAVIADIYMPFTSGIELLTAIKSSTRYVPVIMVTGKPSVDTAVKCMKIGAADYLSKPLSVATIVETVSKVLRPAHDTTGYLKEPVDYIHKKFPVGYRIIDKLGDGGMGVVYLVKRIAPVAAGKFALKIYKPEIFNTKVAAKVRKRFLYEVDAASSVDHPNVVTIHEFGLGVGAMANYIIMEYVRGVTLYEMIEEFEPGDYSRKARLLRDAAMALAAIHRAGICHRDIKPRNLLISQDDVLKVADFGIAKLPGAHITSRFKAVGTPNYMAPEVFKGANDDPRSDFFSLGITAYELLFGVHPFPGHSVAELSEAIRTRDPSPPIDMDQNISSPLGRIVNKMLEKDPERRYQNGDELSQDLEVYLACEKISQN